MDKPLIKHTNRDSWPDSSLRANTHFVSQHEVTLSWECNFRGDLSGLARKRKTETSTGGVF